MNTETKKAIIGFVLLLVILVIYGKWEDKRIEINFATAKAKIISQYRPSKGRMQTRALFYYKGRQYEASNNLHWVDCNDYYFNLKLYGREIYVALDSNYPRNNYLITTRKEYEKLKIEYPLFLDSLQNCNEE